MVIASIVFFGIMQIPEKGTNKSIITESNFSTLQNDFFSQDFNNNTKKIFILGTSEIQALNTTKINSKVQIQCPECMVYNLSRQGESINKRIKTVDSIISANPHLIIYGISEIDFRTLTNAEYKNPKTILPDIGDIIHNEIKPFKYFEFLKIPQSPKDQTWNLIRQLNKDGSLYSSFTPYPNTPFLTIEKTHTIIISELELAQTLVDYNSNEEINDPVKNQSLKNMKEIINKVQKNNHKIVLFITPHHDYLTSKQSIKFKESFQMILSDLENSTDVKIYPRSESYSRLPIWHDTNHIAVNDKSSIYSEDISKIIIEELKP
ncbi:MAG: hypothetical protein EXS75_03415 [Nitrosarchaeum sp.]|nr:hypothetical protein [Nitrosarchaeum sp.]